MAAPAPGDVKCFSTNKTRYLLEFLSCHGDSPMGVVEGTTEGVI